MLRRLYDRTIALAAHPRAELSLAGVSFAESSFFPIPPDVLLIPMILADRARAWRYAFICTVSSVLGGILGYAIGLFLFETIGRMILSFYGLTQDFEEVAGGYNQIGWLMVFLGGGLTPLPYKVITIASGLTQLDFATFVGVSVLARAMRFYVTCALLYRFGPAARTFIERRLGLAFTGLLVLIIGGLILARYLF